MWRGGADLPLSFLPRFLSRCGSGKLFASPACEFSGTRGVAGDFGWGGVLVRCNSGEEADSYLFRLRCGRDCQRHTDETIFTVSRVGGDSNLFA